MIQCAVCQRTPDPNEVIYRVSPYGSNFVGRCWIHLTPEQQEEHGEPDGITELLDPHRLPSAGEE